MGEKIRLFFRGLFGSRLAEHLEEELTLLRDYEMVTMRADFQARLQDKEQVIAELRSEKAALSGKISIYEVKLMTYSSKAGAEVAAQMNPQPKKKPSFAEFIAGQPKTRWQLEQEEWDKKMDEERAADAAKVKQAEALAAK